MSLQQGPVGGARVTLLTGGLVVLMLAVFAGAGILVRKSEPVTSVAPAASKAPEVTPSRNPRRQPDVDVGKPLGNGVFVEIAKGWTQGKADYRSMRALYLDRGAVAVFYAGINPMPWVRKVPLPNLNVVEAASIGFTGRRKKGDATYSLGGECVRLRGVPTVNDISLSVCYAAYAQDLDTVRVEVQQMIASAAGSI